MLSGRDRLLPPAVSPRVGTYRPTSVPATHNPREYGAYRDDVQLRDEPAYHARLRDSSVGATRGPVASSWAARETAALNSDNTTQSLSRGLQTALEASQRESRILSKQLREMKVEPIDTERGERSTAWHTERQKYQEKVSTLENEITQSREAQRKAELGARHSNPTTPRITTARTNGYSSTTTDDAAQVRRLEGELRKAKDMHESQHEGDSAKLVEARATIHSLQSELHTLKEKHTMNNTARERMDSEMHKSRTETSGLSYSLEAAKQRMETLQRELDAARRSGDESVVIDSLKSEIRNLKEKVHASERECDAARKRNQSLSQEVSEHHSSLMKAKADLSESESRQRELRAQYTEKCAEVKREREAAAQVQQKTQSTSALQDQVTVLEEKQEQVRRDSEQRNAELAEARNEEEIMRTKARHFETRVRELTQQLEEARGTNQDETAHLKQRLRSRDEEIEGIREKCDAHRREAVASKAKAEQLQAELAQLSVNTDAQEKDREGEHRFLNAQLSEFTQKLEDKNHDLTAVNEEVRTLRDELAQKERIHAEELNQASDRAEELERLRGQHAHGASRLQEYETTIQDLEERLTTVTEASARDSGEQRAKLQDMENDNKGLARELKSYSDELARLKEELGNTATREQSVERRLHLEQDSATRSREEVSEMEDKLRKTEEEVARKRHDAYEEDQTLRIALQETDRKYREAEEAARSLSLTADEQQKAIDNYKAMLKRHEEAKPKKDDNEKIRGLERQVAELQGLMEHQDAQEKKLRTANDQMKDSVAQAEQVVLEANIDNERLIREVDEYKEVVQRYEALQPAEEQHTHLLQARVEELVAELSKRDKASPAEQGAVQEAAAENAALRTKIDNYETVLQERDETIKARDQTIEERAQTIIERDHAIEQREETIGERDQVIEERGATIRHHTAEREASAAKVAELEGEVQRLVERLSEASTPADNAATQAMLEEAQNETATLRDEVAKCRGMLEERTAADTEDLHNERNALDAELTLVKEDSSRLRQDCEALQLERVHTGTKVVSLETEVQNLHERLTERDNALHNEQDRHRDTQARLQGMEAPDTDRSADADTIQALNERIRALTEELEAQEGGQLDAARATELQAVVDALNSTQRELDAFRAVGSSPEHIADRIQRLEEMLQDVTKELERKDFALQESCATTVEYTTSPEDARRIEEAESMLADAVAASEAHIATIARLQQDAQGDTDGATLTRIASLERDLEENQEDKDREASEHMAKVQELQDSLEYARGRNDKLAASYDEATALVEELEHKVSDLNVQLEKRRERELELASQQYKHMASEGEEKIATLEEQVRELSQSPQRSRDETPDLPPATPGDEDANSLRQQLDEALDRERALLNRPTDDSKVERLEEENERLLTDMEAQCTKMLEMQDECIVLQQAKAELSELAEHLSTRVDHLHEFELEALGRETARAEEELLYAEEAAEMEEKMMHAYVVAHANRAEYETAASGLRRAERRIAEAEEAAASIATKCADTERRHKRLEETYDSLERSQENTAPPQTTEQLRAAEELQQLLQEAEGAAAQYAIRCSDMERENLTLRDTVTDLHKEESLSDHRVHQLRETLRETELKNEALQEMLVGPSAAFPSEVAELNIEVEQALEERDAARLEMKNAQLEVSIFAKRAAELEKQVINNNNNPARRYSAAVRTDSFGTGFNDSEFGSCRDMEESQRDPPPTDDEDTLENNNTVSMTTEAYDSVMKTRSSKPASGLPNPVSDTAFSAEMSGSGSGVSASRHSAAEMAFLETPGAGLHILCDPLGHQGTALEALRKAGPEYSG